MGPNEVNLLRTQAIHTQLLYRVLASTAQYPRLQIHLIIVMVCCQIVYVELLCSD
jgi:hypothetical protein